MNKVELKKVLELHSAWLSGLEGGVRADLSEENLSAENLSGVDLSKATLYKTDLSGAELSESNLSESNLYKANLYKAELSESNLYKANLYKAELSKANLYKANLSESNLYKANLSGAELSESNLCYFQWQQHMAIKYLNRIQIGCEDYTIKEWQGIFPEIGKENGYTQEQIDAYGVFIEMCATLK